MAIVIIDTSALHDRRLEARDFTGRWRIVRRPYCEGLEVELVRRHFFGLVKVNVWVEDYFIDFYEIVTFDCKH